MFVGRKEEINLLKEQYKNKKSSILLYGKRRVGKTTLLKESFKYFDKNCNDLITSSFISSLLFSKFNELYLIYYC